eukprot:12572268-Alexandrium_andersonii.AAC.1
MVARLLLDDDVAPTRPPFSCGLGVQAQLAAGLGQPGAARAIEHNCPAHVGVHASAAERCPAAPKPPPRLGAGGVHVARRDAGERGAA